MKKISIFENKEKFIDLEKLIDTRGLILANSGAGKSYTARKILEESNSEVMSIVIDFEGEFKTLREEYDFLVIGPEGDIPLNMKSAHLLPEKLLQWDMSTIIDISELKRPERAKYVKKFIEALMEIPRKSGLWKPCLIFIDEIHNLAGQQEKQESTYAIIDLATRGRKRGYCLIGCTQRISKLHKDVAAELNNYFAGRTSLDIDMKRTADILGFSSKEDMLSLRSLPDGEFYNFGPAISSIVEIDKVSRSKTTHPRRGEISSKEITPLTDKIKKTLKGLSELPEEADKKLKEVNDYKTEIVRLEREIRKKPVETIVKEVVRVDQSALQKAKEQGFKEAERGYKSYINSIEKDSQNLKRSVIKLIKDAERIVTSKELVKVGDIKMEPIINVHTEKPRLVSHEVSDRFFNNEPKESVSPDTLAICPRKIYSFLFYNSHKEYSKAQIGAVTGYRHGSGGFNNALATLNSMGLIDRSNGNIKVKELDSNLIGEFDFSKEAIVSKLSKCEKEIYTVLTNYPDSEFSKEDLAQETPSMYSHSSGGFNNALSKLNTLGIMIRNNGLIKLHPEMLELD